MQTRSSVLGKRHARAETTSPPPAFPCEDAQAKLPPTPEATPTSKRFKSSATIEDGDNNKENIPPLRVEALRTPRSGRSLRRTASEYMTPPRTRPTPRRASVSATSRRATPATASTPNLLTTPFTSPPAALQPICARARALLRPTCNNLGPMAGRSRERDEIIAFIKPFIASVEDANDHSILYISGSPGTGKTAMVNSVFSDMRVQLEAADVHTYTINCMALCNTEALWDRLKDAFQEEPCKEMKVSKTKKTKETSLETVKRLFASRSKKCVVLLDELDHIASSSQALNIIFNTVENYRTHIRLIGVANTHTLSAHAATEISAHAAGSVKTVHFAPYTAKQLLEILQARLAPLSESKHTTSEKTDTFLPLPTLMLLTKKIAAQTGDVRATFEVLRGAIDIAVNSANSANPLAEPTAPVTPAHVLSALKAYTPASTPAQSTVAGPSPSSGTPRKTSSSEVVNKVRDLSLQARLAVLAAVLARKRLDVGLPISGSAPNTPTSTPRKRNQAAGQTPSSGAIDASHLHAFYKTIIARSNNGAFVPVSRSEFNDLLNVLETVGLVTLSSASSPGSPSKSGRRTASFGAMLGKGTSQEIRFVEGVRMDEITRGLGISDDFASDSGDVKEEEVRSLWDTEKVRISRESKARNTDGFPLEAFGEATED